MEVAGCQVGSRIDAAGRPGACSAFGRCRSVTGKTHPNAANSILGCSATVNTPGGRRLRSEGVASSGTKFMRCSESRGTLP